jgi:hypothetical protein
VSEVSLDAFVRFIWDDGNTLSGIDCWSFAMAAYLIEMGVANRNETEIMKNADDMLQDYVTNHMHACA